MNEMNGAQEQRRKPTAQQIAVGALLLPWVLWTSCLVTGVFAFGPLGFMALIPCGVLVFLFTTRKRLGIPVSEKYPGRWIAARITAGLYALPFIPFAVFVLLRGLER
jgi:hypothetical protein